MKTIKNGIMIGTLGALLLSGCSSFDTQRFACLPKDHSSKDASTKKEAQYTPKGFFDPYSSNLYHWDSTFSVFGRGGEQGG
ncbi:hypothetical protein ID1078_00010 [Helicobacter pylori]